MGVGSRVSLGDNCGNGTLNYGPLGAVYDNGGLNLGPLGDYGYRRDVSTRVLGEY